MPSGIDSMLDSDHLEQLLETPVPTPPVVVVEYRNRGIPAWIVVPMVILVPLIAIVLYHRMVVEKERIQAARERSLVALRIEADRALQPLVRDNAPSTAVLPQPSSSSVAAEVEAGAVSGVSPTPTAAATPVVESETKAAAVPIPAKSGADAAGITGSTPGKPIRTPITSNFRGEGRSELAPSSNEIGTRDYP